MIQSIHAKENKDIEDNHNTLISDYEEIIAYKDSNIFSLIE